MSNENIDSLVARVLHGEPVGQVLDKDWLMSNEKDSKT